MTIVDFEKLVEKDPKRDEIINRVKTGGGVLNNDEEWYDICAQQYNLCNKNIESFFYNLYRILDFKVLKKNNAHFIKERESQYQKIAEYVELHPIEKAKNNDYKERLINDIASIVFNDFFEPQEFSRLMKMVPANLINRSNNSLYDIAVEIELQNNINNIQRF